MRYPFRVYGTITFSDTVSMCLYPSHDENRIPPCQRGLVGTNRPARSRSHALKGHRVALGWLYGHVGVNYPSLIPLFPCLNVGSPTN